MPTCNQCSRQLADDERFCPGCGTPAAGQPTMTAALGSGTPSMPSSDPAGLGHGRFEPGTKLGARYRIVGLLGRGGMGEVYRADDLELGQSVALKFLPEHVVTDPAELGRFRNEVRVARQIAHANVARIYDIGEAAGHVFLSMEYIDGEDLASVLRRMGRPSSDKALEIARQLCLGLAAAHDAGVLHRDLKPANIMIDGRGRVRITDFGLAGFVDELEPRQQLAGTPAYMAPEQLTDGSASTRSDIYSLGLILYEIFTGKRAFETSNIVELKQLHASGSTTTPTSLPRDVDPAVERLVLTCLERDPQQRPASAYAVLGALPGADPLAAALAAGETPSPELVANAGETGALRPRTVLGLAFAILALLGLGVGLGGAGNLDMFEESPAVLSLRAAEVLELAGFDEPPRYSASGFRIVGGLIDELAEDGEPTTAEIAAAAGVVFWKRWSPGPLKSTRLHVPLIRADNPPQSVPGSATVILDVRGRLRGLAVAPTAPGGEEPSTNWSPLLAAAGLDPSALEPTTPPDTPPSHCDTIVAWTGTLPGAPDRRVKIQAGAYRGRPVHFTVIGPGGGSMTEILRPPGLPALANWYVVFLFIGPLVIAVFVGRRNLKLGRGDRRGATRLAVCIMVLYLLQSAFSMRLADGVARSVLDMVFDAPMAHALIHGLSMWFFYVALEPYVRRLWPRMLVSWARLVSGRLRDPLIGRDLMIGCVVALLTILGIGLGGRLLVASGAAPPPPPISGPDTLLAMSGLKGMAYGIVEAVAVAGMLMTMGCLMLAFLAHLLVRRAWLAAAIAGLILAIGMFNVLVGAIGPAISAASAGLFATMTMVCLFRFGLLATATALATLQIVFRIPFTSDLSSWYAGSMLLGLGLLVAAVAYGFYIAVAGQPIVRDLFPEGRAP